MPEIDGQSKVNEVPRLSIVLPCYNEADGLAELIEQYSREMRGNSIELVLVDNGSTDRTSEVLERELSLPERKFARTVKVDVNQGYGHGIFAGLQTARGNYLAWSHADSQCSPHDVLRAFDALQSIPDAEKTLIKGRRQKREWKAELLTFGMQTAAQVLLDWQLRDINAQPKVFHRSLLEHLSSPPKDLSFDLYVLYRALQKDWKIEELPVVFGVRRHGQSKWASTLQSRAHHINRALRYMLELRARGKA